MSREAFPRTSNEGKEGLKEIHPTQAEFDAYLEGNLRLPQMGLGIVTMVSKTLLAENKLDLTSFNNSKLSSDQLAVIKKAMNRTHRARHIPAGTEEGLQEILDDIHAVHGEKKANFFEPIQVNEERLQGIWSSTKRGTLSFIAELGGTQETSVTEDGEATLEHVNVSKVSDLLSDAHVRKQIALQINAIADAILSPEGSLIAKDLRNAFGNKVTGPRRSPEEDEAREEQIIQNKELLLKLILRTYEVRGEQVDEYKIKSFESFLNL